jgi:hypothetical protein
MFLFFACFFTFKDLTDIKQTQYFCHVILSVNRRTGEEEVNGERHEGQKMAHHASRLLDHVLGPVWHLLGLIVAYFASTNSS